MGSSEEKKKSGLSESFIAGAIAIVFLIVGYQTALFIHQAAVMKIAANRDEPDTVYIHVPIAVDSVMTDIVVKKNAVHTPRAEAVRVNVPRKKTESFRFDPNTVSVDDLRRLGFSPKQAQSIDNYRKKGGRFRRKSDFAKSYVVSDSVFRRLEPYIDIPLVDLNLADSAAFDALPGIGGWFASKIIAHRKELGGYSYKEQLMDIYRFDQEKFEALQDLVTVSEEYVAPYPIWSLPADSLRLHPYIRNYETAKAIVLYRENTPPGQWTVEGLHEAGILTDIQYDALSRCIISVQ
jgi:DNA uptake protein ComE-like DNA-binding protein